MSRSDNTSSTAAIGVAGLIATPTWHPCSLDVADGAMQVSAGLGVHQHLIGNAFHQTWHQAVRFVDHEVDIQGKVRCAADGVHHHLAEGDVGHEPAIHDVHVDEISAGGVGVAHLLGQPTEIGREDRRGDLHVSGGCIGIGTHGFIATAAVRYSLPKPPLR